MKLYHGTSLTKAKKILQTGLMPRFNRPGNFTTTGKVSSIPTMVYLAKESIHTEFYGLKALIRDKSDHYVILSCEVDEDRLYPDENYLAVKDEYGQIFKEDMIEGQRQVLLNQDKALSCLEQNGICCHLGAIPTVTLEEVRPVKENIWHFFVDQYGTDEEIDEKMQIYNRAAAVGCITEHRDVRIVIESNIVNVYERDRHVMKAPRVIF